MFKRKSFIAFALSVMLMIPGISIPVLADDEDVSISDFNSTSSSVLDNGQEADFQVAEQANTGTEFSGDLGAGLAGIEEPVSDTGASPDVQGHVRESILRIRTGYRFEDGSFDLWTEGFGFLITKECMITSRPTAIVEEDSQLYRDLKASRNAMYKSVVGVDFNDYTAIMQNVRTYVVTDTGEVEANVNTSAGGDAFAVLNISQRINSRSVAILSDASLKEGTDVYAVGTESTEDIPAMSEFFASPSKISGSRKNGNSEYVNFKGEFSTLIQGCPLINKNQIIVGLITDGAGGNGSAVDIKTIEQSLDAANIEYESIDETGSSPASGENVSFEHLASLIEQANAIDRTIYTPESLKVLDKAVSDAQAVLDDTSATRQRIQKAEEPLESALNSLVEIDHTGDYIKLGVLVVLLVVGIVVALKLRQMLHERGMQDYEIEEEREARVKQKRAKKEARKAKKGSKGKQRPSKKKTPNEGNKQNVPDEFEDERHALDGTFDEDETGVLDRDGVTGVLNDVPVKGWLVNEATGKRVLIDRPKFTIGKSVDGVDFRIDGNNTVSRKHCRILRSGKDFYVEDLGSRNGTYIDGDKVHTGDRVRIYDGQELIISDERFVFEHE